MKEIKVIERRFVFDLSETEVCYLIKALKNFHELTSPIYDFKQKLRDKLGFDPLDD